ncbi:MAG: choice-of-anchor Q domain-containing protein, partial [Acidimicrobiia bacterium]
TTDQRGVTRPQGLGCDVGAVEQAGPASPPAPPSPPLDPTLPGAAQVSNEVVLEPRFTG